MRPKWIFGEAIEQVKRDMRIKLKKFWPLRSCGLLPAPSFSWAADADCRTSSSPSFYPFPWRTLLPRMLEVHVLRRGRLFGDWSFLLCGIYSIFCRLDLTWRSASQGWIGQGLILLISSLVKGGRWTRRNCGECLQLLDRTDSAKTNGTFLILYTQHEHQHHGISFQLLNRAESLKHVPESEH